MNDKKEVGFKSYYLDDKLIIPSPEAIKEMESKVMFLINTEHIKIRPKAPDTRSVFKKFIDDWKRRIEHAWYALKGYECD